MPRGFESHRLRQEQHLAGRCLLFLQQTLQGLQGGIRTARARRFASRRAATVLRTVARARENPTVCAKYHYSISHWVVIFYCRFAKSRYFLIGISPLFSSSDFSGSVQIIPAITANSYSQNYTRFFPSLGYKLTAKRQHPISQVPPSVHVTTSLWAALRAASACLPSSGRSGSWTVNPDARRCLP